MVLPSPDARISVITKYQLMPAEPGPRVATQGSAGFILTTTPEGDIIHCDRPISEMRSPRVRAVLCLLWSPSERAGRGTGVAGVAESVGSGERGPESVALQFSHQWSRSNHGASLVSPLPASRGQENPTHVDAPWWPRCHSCPRHRVIIRRQVCKDAGPPSTSFLSHLLKPTYLSSGTALPAVGAACVFFVPRAALGVKSGCGHGAGNWAESTPPGRLESEARCRLQVGTRGTAGWQPGCACDGDGWVQVWG